MPRAGTVKLVLQDMPEVRAMMFEAMEVAVREGARRERERIVQLVKGRRLMFSSDEQAKGYSHAIDAVLADLGVDVEGGEP